MTQPKTSILQNAKQLLQAGEYAAVRDVLEHSVRTSMPLDQDLAITYATALKALSRYDEAANILQLAKTDRGGIVRSLSTEAEIAWIRHDYDTALALSIECLNHDLCNTKAQSIRDRCIQALAAGNAEENLEHPKDEALSHAAFYIEGGGNFGDIVLPTTVRKSYDSVRPVKHWEPFHVHQIFDKECVRRVNQTKGLVVGGGGLFLPDTAPNGNSGWQWNIAHENLRAIEVPIAVSAVGYNLFEGQEMLTKVFSESLHLLVEKSKVFGLRNHGSMEKVRALLAPSLRDKVEYMPCPTTILDRLEPGLEARKGVEDVLLNIAYDRANLRFKSNYAQFLSEMESYICKLRKMGYTVACAAHLQRDETFARDLEKLPAGVRLRVYGLYDMSPGEGYSLYKGAGVVVGMRGHATMIPFGLGTPVLSIISHPKLRYFLEDIQREEWGVQVSDDQLGAQLFERTIDLLMNRASIVEDISTIQEDLYAQVRACAKRFVG